MQSETCVPRTRNMCSDDEQIDFIVKMTCLLHHQTKSLILLIFCEVLLSSLNVVFVRRSGGEPIGIGLNANVVC